MQNDVTYLAIIFGLFAVMFLLVKVCDLIIGSDDAALEDQGTGPATRVAVADDDRPAVAA